MHKKTKKRKNPWKRDKFFLKNPEYEVLNWTIVEENYI